MHIPFPLSAFEVRTLKALQDKYFDMGLIRAYQSAAKTLLAHFHYANKGAVPFQSDFDWTLPLHRKMAEFTDEDFQAVGHITLEVSQKGK